MDGKSEFPGGSREAASAFSIGEKGYICLGFGSRTLEGRYGDLWEYDPASDRWTQKADFGGDDRNYAVAFVIGDVGFVGTGNSLTDKFDDFWRYLPETDTWESIEAYAGGKRSMQLSYVIEQTDKVGGSEIFSFEEKSDAY